MPEKEYASKGVAGTGLGLGIAGTALGLLNNNGNLLGNLLGGRNSEQTEKISELVAENTLLKAQKYSDDNAKNLQSQICEMRVENANKFGDVNAAMVKQGEQINCIKSSAELRDQIIDGKMAQVAQSANCGISTLQQQLNCLQQTVNNISSTYVPAGKVTPLPAPNPFPPVPPYAPYPYPPFPFIPPVVPPTTNSGGTTTTNTTNTTNP